jgi:hypothetical protein
MRKKAPLANVVDSLLLNTTFVYALKYNLGDDFFQAIILSISLVINLTQNMEVLLGWTISTDEMTEERRFESLT